MLMHAGRRKFFGKASLEYGTAPHRGRSRLSSELSRQTFVIVVVVVVAVGVVGTSHQFGTSATVFSGVAFLRRAVGVSSLGKGALCEGFEAAKPITGEIVGAYVRRHVCNTNNCFYFFCVCGRAICCFLVVGSKCSGSCCSTQPKSEYGPFLGRGRWFLLQACRSFLQRTRRRENMGRLGLYTSCAHKYPVDINVNDPLEFRNIVANTILTLLLMDVDDAWMPPGAVPGAG